ncbi:hypothetical protein [Bordetella trematum]|uniref:hypothetical protein n=1 Tax=Bordetella trematum TaxID=123899 RepID=UPI00398A0B53
MSRYRRVNLDGLSVTETRSAAAALLPGTFAVINGDDEFAAATAIVGRMYVINPAYSQGLGITDPVPAGDSAVGEYVEESRELAVRVGPGTYTKDQPITVNATGQAIAVPATAGTYTIIGYSQDDATIASGTTDFIRIRVRASAVTVS